MNKGYEYYGSCVELDGGEIQKMRDASVAVTLQSMARNCVGLVEWALRAGYQRYRRDGLVLSDDWHVSYHKSEYAGRPCFYLCWSAQEHVWIKSDEPIEKREVRTYPIQCQSAYCGRAVCPDHCRHLPALREFKEWVERTDAHVPDHIWSRNTYIARRSATDKEG